MKSLYSLLALLLCFAATAVSNPMPNQLSSRATCSLSTITSAMSEIQEGVEYPHQFCSWYLSAGRTRSPFDIKGMTVSAVQNACMCLGYSKPTTTPKATTTMTPGAVTTNCPAANIALLRSRYTDTTAFCEFFNAAPRDTSPLQVLGVKGVWNACNCILGKASTSSSASSTSTFPSTTITSSTTATTSAIITSSLSSSVRGSTYAVSTSSTAITNSTSSSSTTFSTTSASASITTSSTTLSTTTSTVASTTSSDPYPSATLGYAGGAQWGFSSTPAIGSALEVSDTPFEDVFSWSGDTSTTGNIGYMVHADTGLCLTLIAPTTTQTSEQFTGTYGGGEVQLQSCDLDNTPPPTQNFVYGSTAGDSYTFNVQADETYYSLQPSGDSVIDVLSSSPGGGSWWYCLTPLD